MIVSAPFPELAKPSVVVSTFWFGLLVFTFFTIPINPIIPGVQKPYSARGGASEAPRVKSHHSGLPDGPMPYNDNNMLCLGINKPSYVVFHVIGVCQKGRESGRDDNG